MTAKQFVGTLVFALTEFVLPLAQAGDIHVLVRPEVSGTEMVYHYELINHGTGRIKNLGIGVTPDDPNDLDGPSVGMLSRLPTGTIWDMAPAMSLDHPEFPNIRAGVLIPIPSPTSVLSPPRWRAEISGAVRLPTGVTSPEDIANERYSIDWYAPKPVHKGPLDVTGADAGQRLAGFTVRVTPALGDIPTKPPGCLNPPCYTPQVVKEPRSLALAAYTQGEFVADLWSGSSFSDYFNFERQYKRRGRITLSPSMEVAFTLKPNDVNQIAPSSFVAVAANITPLVYNEPSPTIRLESIVCRGDCQQNEGILDAAFGSDDREFRLQAAPQPAGNRLPYGRRLYDVTYSVTDAAGTRQLVTSTVTIVSKQLVFTTLPIPGSGRRLTK